MRIIRARRTKSNIAPILEVERESKKASKANQYSLFLRLLEENTGYHWESEYKFHPTRKWRFDFALPSKKVAIEIDGGVFTAGRHSGGIGQIKDMEKMNAAASLGWRVLHFIPRQTTELTTLELITKTIEDDNFIRDI